MEHMRKKVVVIGGGFAGTTVIRWLSWYKKEIDITLVDRKCHFEFLPLLPDTISNKVNPHSLAYPLPSFSKRHSCAFLNASVTGVDFTRRVVITEHAELPYDFVVIASGCQTNYFDSEGSKNLLYPVNTVDDVIRIRVSMQEKIHSSYVVVGGGYTGIETATNLRRYVLARGEKDSRVVVVERQQDILGPLPSWMKEYVRENLVKMGVGIITGVTVTGVTKEQVTLSSGEVFKDPMLFWSPGVKTAAFVEGLDAKRTPQGRLIVDRFLRLNESCFAIGDTAAFSPVQTPLRMAVQFAISQGESAAANILAAMRGEGLKHYRAIDPGYVVPMANNTACGYVLGMKMQGLLPLVLHYLLCIYRSYGIRNKVHVARNVCWDSLWDSE
jgi:NADH:ubiquinone reductase (H+-translocating)